ncbi:MAG: AlpA family phage regulatory protein [Pseudomonas sp.]
MRRIMRLREVIYVCGIGRSTIYLWMQTGKFPKSRLIGSRAVGWDSEEIQKWVNDRLSGREWTGEET